jgi:ubiquinone/menaquinone biosynthesis C-methylase UbiE
MEASEPESRASAFDISSVPENYERRLAPALFGPWAEILIGMVGVQPGDQVLDGAVARLAASGAGSAGRVVASDVSRAMLAYAATVPAPPDGAPIEYLEASVTELPLHDGSFDLVLCQHGMPFFTDRPAAAREMLRVLRPGGSVGLSVWMAGRRLEPFDEYIAAITASGLEPPFPGAFDSGTFKMAEDELRGVLEGAGCESVELRAIEYEATWDDAESVALGVLGTPFAPLLDQLPSDRRAALDTDLLRRFAPSAPGEPVRRLTAALVARAVAPAG